LRGETELMKQSSIKQRVDEFVGIDDPDTLLQEGQFLARDLGAELTEKRIPVIRDYQRCVDAVRPVKEAKSLHRPSFLAGFISGTYFLCEGFVAFLAPELERKAISFRKTQWNILCCLRDAKGSVGTAEVASQIGAHPSAVSRALKGLKNEGYVDFDTPQSGVEDRRRRRFSLTELGWRSVSGVPGKQPEPAGAGAAVAAKVAHAPAAARARAPIASVASASTAPVYSNVRDPNAGARATRRGGVEATNLRHAIQRKRSERALSGVGS
jgi:DNA-binding MarR family transcriptional regulator